MEKRETENANVNEVANEQEGRRSFIKNIIVGAAAAGALTASTGEPAEAKERNSSGINPAVIDPCAGAVINIRFNRLKPPTLDDVFEAIRQGLAPTGCTRCGFDGIDAILKLETIVDPATPPYQVSIEGQF